MATLTNTKIKDTYDGLLKTENENVLPVSGVTLIEDGLGNASALSLGRANNGVTITGALVASGLTYPTTDGTSGQALATDGAGNLSFIDVIVTTPNLQEVTDVSPASTTNSITVGGITAASLAYPSADGTNGQAIVTDGAGNLSFATVSGATPTLDQVTGAGETSSRNVVINGADLGTITNSSNTLFGDGALASHTSGVSNTAIGQNALTAYTGGSDNTAVGAGTLDAIISSGNLRNTAVGSNALGSGTTLIGNTSVGYEALLNISGQYNVALGLNAGKLIYGGNKTLGDNNVYIGANTDSAAADTDNEIVIGASAVGNGSNSATYGNSSIIRHYFTSGKLRINSGSELEFGGTNVSINGNSTSNTMNFYVSSTLAMQISSSAIDIDSGALYVDRVNNRIGIGTLNPASLLHIQSNSSPTLTLDHTEKATWGVGDVVGKIDYYTSDASGNAPYSTAFIQSENETGGGTLPSGALVFGTATYNAVGGAVERMRIDSSGNVGINCSPVSQFDVKNASSARYVIQCFSSANSSLGGLYEDSSNNGELYVKAAGNVTNILLNSSGDSYLKGGNVGIGVTPTEKLDVYGSIKIGTTANSNFLNRSDSHWIQYNGGATTNDTFVRVASINAASIGRTISFHTNAAERMRITSDGNVRIGGNFTSADPIADRVDGLSIGEGAAGRMKIFSTSNDSLLVGRGGTGDVVEFWYNATGTPSRAGVISITSATTSSFNTSPSDLRLKKNIESWDDNVLDDFKVTIPKLFHYNVEEDTDPKTKGYIAQEMVDKFPEAYPKDDDGYHMYNPSGMVVYLIKAVKELTEKLEQLESQLNA